LGRVRALAKDFPAEAIDAVFREVLSASSALAAPMTAAYCGPLGAFAHVAARRYFGASIKLRTEDSVHQVFDAVARANVLFGVVPLETSTDGALTATLLALTESDVKMCGEITVPSNYHLFSKSGNAADVQKVCGVPHAIAACERFIRTNFPRASVMDMPSTDGAAQIVLEDASAAVVGTGILRELYELRPIQERIEDTVGVELRFAVVGNDFPPRTGLDRTWLALSLQDSPGALYRALQPFAERNVNITRLESRPIVGAAWRHMFIEFDGHVTDRAILTAVEELRGVSRVVKILGSYPRPSEPTP
jgi:chorismate mutase/prephenate dehydratase